MKVLSLWWLLFKDINLNLRLLGYPQPPIIVRLWKFLDQDLCVKSVRIEKSARRWPQRGVHISSISQFVLSLCRIHVRGKWEHFVDNFDIWIKQFSDSKRIFTNFETDKTAEMQHCVGLSSSTNSYWLITNQQWIIFNKNKNQNNDDKTFNLAKRTFLFPLFIRPHWFVDYFHPQKLIQMLYCLSNKLMFY